MSTTDRYRCISYNEARLKIRLNASKTISLQFSDFTFLNQILWDVCFLYSLLVLKSAPKKVKII